MNQHLPVWWRAPLPEDAGLHTADGGQLLRQASEFKYFRVFFSLDRENKSWDGRTVRRSTSCNSAMVLDPRTEEGAELNGNDFSLSVDPRDTSQL